MELPFAGLHQLCAPLLDRLERLPDPQRDALRVAFGLTGGDAPDRFLVALAVLGLLSEAAEEQPLVCVIDDVQWLDRASAQALATRPSGRPSTSANLRARGRKAATASSPCHSAAADMISLREQASRSTASRRMLGTIGGSAGGDRCSSTKPAVSDGRFDPRPTAPSDEKRKSTFPRERLESTTPYLCRDHAASARSGVDVVGGRGSDRDCWLGAGGGALSSLGRPAGPSAKRLTGAVAALVDGACARAPGLIWVRGPGWLRVGDKMVDGVIPQTSVRPLGLSGPSTRTWRLEQFGNWPRCIGVSEGCARMTASSGGRQRLLAEL
jgi:hypothetical protein